MSDVPPQVPPVPPVDWLGIKHVYMYGDGTGKVYGYCALSKKFGAKEDTIKRRGQREGWAEQRAAVAGQPVPPVPLPPPLVPPRVVVPAPPKEAPPAPPAPPPEMKASLASETQDGTLLPAPSPTDLQTKMAQEEVKLRAQHFRILSTTAKGLEQYLASQMTTDGKIVLMPATAKTVVQMSRSALQAVNMAVYGVAAAIHQAPAASIPGEVLGSGPNSTQSLYALLLASRGAAPEAPDELPISAFEEPTTLPPHLSSCKRV